MNDTNREIILKTCANVYLVCLLILLLLSISFGKETGRLFLLTVLSLYSLFYVLMYNYICRGFKDKIRKMYAFGNIAGGTLVGAIYYSSM